MPENTAELTGQLFAPENYYRITATIGHGYREREQTQLIRNEYTLIH